MVMTDAMDEVDYATVDFNDDGDDCDYDNHAASLRRHPLWLTEGHFLYHLARHPDGRLGFVKDKHGEALCSPRMLQDLCLCQLVSDSEPLGHLQTHAIPADLYPRLLTEAVLQRQLKAISQLVANWPFTLLHLQSVIPGEELLCDDYLTSTSTSTSSAMSLLDSLSIGLLNLQPSARLRCVNLTGFTHDRRLCQELLRLPLLWMRPADRQTDRLHAALATTLAISKEKVQQYVSRISTIYSNIDLMVRHGHTFGPITIVLDCKLTTDDAAIGLALQHQSPFRFLCQRVWVEVLPDVVVTTSSLNKVLEARFVTHLCLEDPDVCSQPDSWDRLLLGLASLQSLTSLSLPNTVHVTQRPRAMAELAEVVHGLPALRKMSLASCTLRNSVHCLLAPPTRAPPTLTLTYLSLRDCRLSETDMAALLLWPGVTDLLELNLSRNNLGLAAATLVCLLSRMEQITCFAISYCSLSTSAVRQIVRHCMDCEHLKALCIQSFIPPPLYEVRGILEDCALIATLQKCVLLPEAYAFPGANISQRADNHHRTGLIACQILHQLGRGDIELE